LVGWWVWYIKVFTKLTQVTAVTHTRAKLKLRNKKNVCMCVSEKCKQTCCRETESGFELNKYKKRTKERQQTRETHLNVLKKF
jgi:hypothetical protein